MKYLFLTVFVLLLGLSVGAYVWTPKADSSGKLEIVWASDDNPRRREQIKLFNELHPGYLLKLDAANESLDKVLTQSLAGVGPDVFDGFADRVGLLYDAGLLEDVTAPLAARGITLDKLWPLAHPAVAIDGKMYGVPFNCGGNALWFHKDMFDQAGVAYPPDNGLKWDQFVELAKKMTKRRADGRIERYGVMGLVFHDVMLTNGGRYFTPDGRKCVIDSPESVEALRLWLDLQNVHKVMPDPEEEKALSTSGGWGSGTISIFQERRTAMASGGRWWLCILRDVRDKDGKFPFDLGAVEKPVTRYRRFEGGPRVTYVNAKGKNKERAIEFLTFLCSQEFSDQLNRDADAMPGRIDKSGPDSVFYTYAPNGDRDPGNKEIWKDLMIYATTGELSPYITPREFNDILDKQIALTTGGRPTAKKPADALREAAASVNAAIARNVERSDRLKERFNNGDTAPALGNPPLTWRADEVVK